MSFDSTTSEAQPTLPGAETALRSTAPNAGPVLPSMSVATPCSLTEGSFGSSGFWGQWQTLNGEVMIEHARTWMERLGWVDNLRAAALGGLPEGRRGREFTDSDVYKLVEAMSWELGRCPSNASLRRHRDELVAIIANAQDSDGYINSMYGRARQAARYSDLEWGHELYNYGHLLQAAVAYGRVEGAGSLVEVARRVADHLIEYFNELGDQRYCGHPNIEMALVEFGRLTNDRRYIDQAALFVERRGAGRLKSGEFGSDYFQDLLPVRNTLALHGHAVRALYLAAGAVDVAVERADDKLLRVLEQQWEQTVSRRTHVTGGMGSRHTGEAFGEDWELSPDRAYCETCAGAGSIMFSWRLYLATGKMRYADLIERTLFNIIATSPGLDGRSFFYSNPLQQRSPGEIPEHDEPSSRSATSARAPWFDVSCCLPNVSRVLASLSTYAVAASEEGVQVLQFGEGTWTVATSAGPVTIAVETDYPRSGVITVKVADAPRQGTTVTLRVPEWSTSTDVNAGDGITIDQEPGMVSFSDVVSGDEVSISLDMRPRLVRAAPQVDALRGCVAVERGPRVFALEGIDLPAGVSIANVSVELEGHITVTGPDELQLQGHFLKAETNHSWPYSSVLPDDNVLPLPITMRPYHDWGRRGSTTMRIWMPVDNSGTLS